MKQSLLRLVIDSATPYLTVMLYEGEVLLHEFYEKGKNDHSVKLMQEIERMFSSAGKSLDDVDAIICGIGPGSYTGLRIGVVVAKMLAYAKDVPLYTVSSLALLASSASFEGIVLPFIDARRGHVFCGLYLMKDGCLSLLEHERYTDFNEYVLTLEGTIHKVSEGKMRLDVLLKSDGLLTRVKNIHTLAPIYLRETEAERNLRDQH